MGDEVLRNYIPVTFGQADAVAEKLSKRFGNKPWLNGVGVVADEDCGYVVRLGIDAEMLQLKPYEFEYFCFTQIVDGVQVCLVPEEIAVAFDKRKD